MERAGQTFVIVGAGMAGARAAITLRKEGFDGRALLIGDEPDAPYERPPLSKGYLRGEQEPAELTIRPKDQGWHDIGVELRTGTSVTRIDRAAGSVELADGTSIRFDRLLLATGSAPRRLALPGSTWTGCSRYGPCGTRTASVPRSGSTAGSWSSAVAGSGRRWLHAPAS